MEMRTTGIEGAQMNPLPAHSCCQGASGTSLTISRWNRYLPTWLQGTRGVILAAVAVAGGGAALGWPWLVAIGVAPILLSVLPCAVMCALGLCMMGKSTRSSAGQGASTPATIEAVTPMLLDGQSVRVPSPPSDIEREPATLS